MIIIHAQFRRLNCFCILLWYFFFLSFFLDWRNPNLITRLRPNAIYQSKPDIPPEVDPRIFSHSSSANPNSQNAKHWLIFRLINIFPCLFSTCGTQQLGWGPLTIKKDAARERQNGPGIVAMCCLFASTISTEKPEKWRKALNKLQKDKRSLELIYDCLYYFKQ